MKGAMAEHQAIDEIKLVGLRIRVKALPLSLALFY
jgi:hypothetical protein